MLSQQRRTSLIARLAAPQSRTDGVQEELGEGGFRSDERSTQARGRGRGGGRVARGREEVVGRAWPRLAGGHQAAENQVEGRHGRQRVGRRRRCRELSGGFVVLTETSG